MALGNIWPSLQSSYSGINRSGALVCQNKKETDLISKTKEIVQEQPQNYW
jgi:hypothetical protein